ncbi:MAG: uL15 family ribosomal protein [Clostridia bacterium]|nr:uL15 family ribosomal protein [Clostridia bacterium]
MTSHGAQEELADAPAPAAEPSADSACEHSEEPYLPPVAEPVPPTEPSDDATIVDIPPASDTVAEEEYISIFDVFPTVEYETEDEPPRLGITPPASEAVAQPLEASSHPETAVATIAPTQTAPVPTRTRKKKKRKKRAKKESALERFFEFIFAPWHRDAARHAERTVAHATHGQGDGVYTQPDTEGRDFFGITEEEADRLLSDRSAEALLEYRNAPIVTYGKRRAIINIDTLSEHFSSGERVDIEILKARSLIPYDTLHIKVLARGSINKPLYVFANDFSLCAIKMLLLSGGKAVKQKTKSTPFSLGTKGKGRKS